MDVWTLLAIVGIIGAVIAIPMALRLPPKHKHEH